MSGPFACFVADSRKWCRTAIRSLTIRLSEAVDIYELNRREVMAQHGIIDTQRSYSADVSERFMHVRNRVVVIIAPYS
jgi:hypothetical protein